MDSSRRQGDWSNISPQPTVAAKHQLPTTENQRCEKGFLDMRQGKHKVFIDILIEGPAINPKKTD